VGDFTWSTLFGALVVLINGTAFGVWLKTRPRMAEIQSHREESEAARLGARVDTLEKMVDRLHSKIDQERAEHDALITVMRHRLNNSREVLRSMITLLRVAPEKVSVALDRIEAMMAEQEKQEAAEKAAFHAVRLAAVAATDDRVRGTSV
jgi:phage shock protein A